MSSIPTFQAELLLKCQNELGEGIVWDSKTQLLHWVDLLKSELHTLDVTTKKYSVDVYPESPYLTFIAPLSKSQGLIGTLSGSLVLLPSPTTPTSTTVPAERTSRQSQKTLSSPLDQNQLKDDSIRFNDGGIDPSGNVLYGSMGINESTGDNNGQLWFYDSATKQEKKLLDDVGVSNGLGWSPDGKTAYYIDSKRPVISTYTYSPTTGLTNQQTLISKPPPMDDSRPTEGVWDGLCLDGIGNIWAARWRDERVIGINPQGEIIAQIKLEGVKSPTIPCFGGPNLDQMYIATASSHLGGEGDSDKYPNSGDLFVLDFGPNSEIRKILPENWKGAERHRASF